MPQCNGLTFSKKFVKKRIQSWQAHLERISPFLVEGVWWREFGDNYIFRDGDNDPNYHTQGPTLLHFRTSSLKDVSERQKAAWKQIIDQHVHLPTSSISIYDQNGKLKGTRTFTTVASSTTHSFIHHHLWTFRPPSLRHLARHPPRKQREVGLTL